MEKEEIVTYNAHLELVLQVVSVSSPVFSFLVLKFASLHATLLLDALTFFIAFVLVAFLPKEVVKVQEKKQFTGKDIFSDIKEGLDYIWHQKDIFFLLLVASGVNFFFAAFEFLLPFSNRLYGGKGAYATILTLGAIGSILGALVANKITSSMKILLFLLIMAGVGVFMMGLPLPTYLSFSGNLVCEFFVTIFDIHVFTEVQTKVEDDYLGRVLSTIYTLAVLFIPIAKGLMTWLPSVCMESFLFIGAGVILFSLLDQLVAKQLQSKEQ